MARRGELWADNSLKHRVRCLGMRLHHEVRHGAARRGVARLGWAWHGKGCQQRQAHDVCLPKRIAS